MASVNKFFISCPGEHDAGILPVTATVDLPMPDNEPEYLFTVREALHDAFVKIWDDKRITVMTDCDG